MTDEEKETLAMSISQPKLKMLEAQIVEQTNKTSSLLQDLGQFREQTVGLEKSLEEANSRIKQKEHALMTLQTVHPTYGKLLAEMGNRRVFATFPERLCNSELFPTYEAQRAFRPERAEAIATSIRRDDRFSGFPGMVTLFEFVGEVAAQTRGHQVRGIVDGQHRVGAIRLLMESGHWPKNRLVATEVFTVREHSDAARLFMDINKMEPVKDIDMVGIKLDVAESQAERAALEEELVIKSAVDVVIQRMQIKYAKMFSLSENCRVPNVHADTFRNALFKSLEARKVAKEQGTAGLEAWLKERNTEIKKDVNKSSSGTAALEKAEANDFYFGMVKNFQWLV